MPCLLAPTVRQFRAVLCVPPLHQAVVTDLAYSDLADPDLADPDLADPEVNTFAHQASPRDHAKIEGRRASRKTTVIE